MKKPILFIVLGAVVLAGSYAVAEYVQFPKIQQGTESPAPAASYAIGFDNPRILLGYAQNVFAARVLTETGSTPQTLPGGGQLSHFQYEVEVLYNIKGSANGKIVVDLEAFEGARLISGGTYLLAARHWSETGSWYYIGSPSVFHSLVSEDSHLSNGQLVEMIKKNNKTYELLNAYPNEILREVDVQKNRTVNSFQSLSDMDRQVVYGKFQELIPSRPVPALFPPPPSPAEPENSWSRCGDGKDNDKDGLIDKADPDCGGVLREDLPALCGDNIDNDRDGLKDAADPDCAPFYPQPTPPPPPAPSSTPSSTPR